MSRAGSNPLQVTRDPFGWTGRAYRPLLAPGRLTFVLASGVDVRSSALLSLAIELLSAQRPMPSADAAVVVYSGMGPLDALKARFLCLLTHAMPPDLTKLRKAREVLADMSAPALHADPCLRSQAASEEVRLLAGMWSLAEVADYLKDPGSRSPWPDRARLDAARDVYDRFRDRLVLADSPRGDLTRILDHARALRAVRPIGAVLVDSPWTDPFAAELDGADRPAPLAMLRSLAGELGAPVVSSVARLNMPIDAVVPSEPEGSIGSEVCTVDISEGTVLATRTLVLVTLHGSPTGILAFDPRSATFRQPIPGEFETDELLAPADGEI